MDDETKPVDAQAPVEQTAAEKPAEEQPAAEKPAEEQPAEQPAAEEKPAEAQPAVEEKLPPPEMRPTIVVAFTGPDSAMFDVRFLNFTPLAAIYQMAAFAKWLDERCSFFMQMNFEQQFANNAVQAQLRQEAAKGQPKTKQGPAGLVIPPPGARVPTRPR